MRGIEKTTINFEENLTKRKKDEKRPTFAT